MQNVFYREEAQRIANEMKVRGWAKNMTNGTVKMAVEAESEVLEDFVKWCWKGSDTSYVKGVRVYEGILEGFDNFKIK